MTQTEIFFVRLLFFSVWTILIVICLSPQISREVFLNTFGRDCKNNNDDDMIKNNGDENGKQTSKTKSIHKVA